MRKRTIPLALAGLLVIGGCADLSETQQRTLSGTAIGAAGGAAIGLMVGRPQTGAAIGAGVGAAGGYLYSRIKDE